MPGTLYIPPSDQFNYYSPDGAVLTDSVGNVVFYICISDFTEDNSVPGRLVPREQAGPINISWRGNEENFVTRSPFSLLEPERSIYIAEFELPVDWNAGWGDSQTFNQGFGDTSNVETTITNDHQMIQTGKFGSRHPVAPNWWFVRIMADPVNHPAWKTQSERDQILHLNPDFDPKYTWGAFGDVYKGSGGFLYPPNMDPWLDRQLVDDEFAGCYKIQINDMKAPSCAGKYFFKIFYTGTFQPLAWMNIQQPPIDPADPNAQWNTIWGGLGGWPAGWQSLGSPDNDLSITAYGGETYVHDPWSGYLNGYWEKYDTFPPENYPVILVKGEIDPGYISGTVRYCGHSQYYYGQFYGEGVHTSGKVVAKGTALDPITNEPTGRPVCAVGWFLGELPGQEDWWKDRQTGSQGFYEIEGVAAGVYTLTAYAAGFVPRTLATQITVKRGQSLNGIDIYVCPTAKLQTKIYSKCPTGPVDWPEYVTLDGFPSRNVILPVVPGGADVRGTTLSDSGGQSVAADGVYYWATEGASTVQFKNLWAELMSSLTPPPAAALQPADLAAWLMPGGPGTLRTPIEGRFGWAWQELIDQNGTVVAWQDYTFDLAQDSRTFGTFWGDPSCYSGVETAWDGHVPTFLADFTSGLVPGSYRVRTWVFGYVQTREYVVDFPSVEFPGTAYMEMDLFKGGTINATVHFHLQELPSAEIDPQMDPNGNPTGFQAHLVMEAIDANGIIQAWNSTDDFSWQDKDQSQGLSLMLIGDSNAWCNEGRVHGMPEGTYTIKAYVKDYLQQEFPQHTVQYCTNGTLSFHLIRGAAIKVQVYSRDCQDPTQPVNWVHPGETIMIDLCSSAGSIFTPDYAIRNWAFQDPTTDNVAIWAAGGTWGLTDYIYYCGGVKPHGLPTDIYTITVRTPGYVQLQFPEVWAQKGSSVGDIPVYLFIGPEIRVIVDFKTELLPSPLPPDYYSYHFRVEAFNENGTLEAANITSVPQATINTYSQAPWPGALNPAQPDGVQTWVFQLQGFGPFTTPQNGPNWGRPYGTVYNGANYWQLQGYNDCGPKTIFCLGRGPTGDHENYGIMWGKTYTVVVSEESEGMFIQLSTVTATPTCKGITTVILEMDRMAHIEGFVYTRNYMGDFRAGSWLMAEAQGANLEEPASGPYDGAYDMYVTPETYTVTAEGPGYIGASRTIVTTWGGDSTGQDFYLEESGLPIPEFPAVGLLALTSTLAASLYILRWRRQTEIPVNPRAQTS
jgi:hypothetical protein